MGQGTVGAALVMNINSVALNFSGKSKISPIPFLKEMFNVTHKKKSFMPGFDL